MKYICEKCGKDFECILEVEDDCEYPYSCPYAVEEKDMDSEWIEFKESKNMKNKDSLVICDSCANNDETCTACNGCISGSNFVRKVINCTENCTECNCDKLAPGNDPGYSHNRDWKPIEKIENLSCSKDPKSRYYDAGGIETLDIIKAKLTPEQYRGFLLGNIIKYSCRVNHKGNFDRDIEKVRFYGNSIFDTLEV